MKRMDNINSLILIAWIILIASFILIHILSSLYIFATHTDCPSDIPGNHLVKIETTYLLICLLSLISSYHTLMSDKS